MTKYEVRVQLYNSADDKPVVFTTVDAETPTKAMEAAYWKLRSELGPCTGIAPASAVTVKDEA
jgi:hypothetical protein